MRRLALAAALLALAAAPAPAPAAPAAAAPPRCERRPVPAPPSAHPAMPAAIGAYLRTVDRLSDRVRTGVMGHSVQGRPLPYALVSDARNLAPGRLAAITARLRALRDGEGGATGGDLPAIVWLAAGVHANEPSGADADLGVLRDLAAGEHCDQLRRLIVVIAPVQNPDGRVAGTRTNAYGFDLNRDWFARTQPETEAKVRLMTRLPPVALADQHEMDGGGFFFPPNADPIHHEIAPAALHAIGHDFGASLARAFRRAHDDFASYAAFDLFFMGYADTVSTTLFGAAGMTFEKGGAVPFAERMDEHALAARTLLAVAARRRTELLRGWAALWRQARDDGAAGRLQPNVVVQPGHHVRFAVPDRPVHAYLLRADVHAADAAALVDRLHSVGVQVGRLTRDVALDAFRPYGSAAPEHATLPAGTWVVPMAQTQKRWIEAMLAQDAYVPFPYFYDVSSWSNPPLMGLAGGWSEQPLAADAVALGATATPATPALDAPAYAFAGDSAGALGLAFDLLRRGDAVTRVPGAGTVTVAGIARDVLAAAAAARRVEVHGVDAAPPTAVALRAPKVALLADLAPVVAGRAGHENSVVHESHGWTRFVLEQRFGLPVDVLGERDLAGGRLQAGGYTALVVADGQLPAGALSPGSYGAIQGFVRGGGTYVGVRSLGLQVARAAGITAVRERPAGAAFHVPGATFAVEVDGADPLGWGAGGPGFQFNAGDPVLEPGGGTAVVRYPAAGGFVSGYVEGAAPLNGTPALVDTTFGAGRVALFASDPSFRGYAEGGQRLLANALLAPPPPAARARHTRRAPVRPPSTTVGMRPRDVVIRVPVGDEARLATAPLPPGARIDGATLTVPNPAGTDPAELGWLHDLLASLAAEGVRPDIVVS